MNNVAGEKQADRSFFRIWKQARANRYLYLMLIPVVGYFLIFSYKPMYGAIIAFKDFNPYAGINGSDWVGLKHFRQFFESFYFGRLLRNTILLSVYSLAVIFPASIILALLLNEVRNKWFKSVVQTLSYLPYFISLIVICGMIVNFSGPDGILSKLLVSLGIIDAPVDFLSLSSWYRTIHVGSSLWQYVGWNSIIYLAALSGISPSLYEAAVMDGANRRHQLIHITLPGIKNTIVILLILNIGSLMDSNWEKILLLYSPSTYETADVISTYVYRRGVQEANYSFSAAIGLFNSIINFSLLVAANFWSRRLTSNSLW
ncbi:ABC transporter permease [Cohnella rhizosphaerae]|uniref:ABC transporter permease subunit n=1 Tax=Cohnella rhizosphaerae TaxID=1457232 RepID=A0A9X4KZW2_9BACL|nr:ABC transporter permease subunit [Cohnella rhizosphaerae]MDG0813541.1 ABC transporter permease subunit [Cohnella rhizosphaerae]